MQLDTRTIAQLLECIPRAEEVQERGAALILEPLLISERRERLAWRTRDKQDGVAGALTILVPDGRGVQLEAVCPGCDFLVTLADHLTKAIVQLRRNTLEPDAHAS